MTRREEFEQALRELNIDEFYSLELSEGGDGYGYKDISTKILFAGFRIGMESAKAQAVPQWIPVSERLPDEDYGYFLVTRKHWRIDDPRVCCSFYIKDRDRAKREYANGYSRKYQGKDSIHFECSRGGFIITHWMPFPAAPEQQK